MSLNSVGRWKEEKDLPGATATLLGASFGDRGDEEGLHAHPWIVDLLFGKARIHHIDNAW